MDSGLERGTTTLQDVLNRNIGPQVDRLTSLPDELLIRIVSLLPTKDAAVTCTLSKKLRCIFPWITSLNFDDSPISHCLKHPRLIQSFPTFVTFVDNVLQKNQSQHLARFRLRFGVDFVTRYIQNCNSEAGGCPKDCFPDLKSVHIDAWIAFPLSRYGLKELDLRIHVREPGHYQMPTSIFMCETLEVLKLDVNLGLVQVSTMPTFCLPNLKLLHLHASLISEDGFLARLVSSCPLLEDLTVEAWWNHVNVMSICSPSLRRLCLKMHKLDPYGNIDIMHIHTPNLEYFVYLDNLARQYSISNMPSLVKAYIAIVNELLQEDVEVSNQQRVKLIRSLSNAQDLSLIGSCTTDLNFLELKDQLPEFPNLKTLDMGYTGARYWGKSLLAFLNHLPVLEALGFSRGLVRGLVGYDDGIEDELEMEPPELERYSFRKAVSTYLSSPLCCRSHLKRIVIEYYNGTEQEVAMIRCMLRHAFVLKELVVCRNEQSTVDQMVLQSTLENLPRASVYCSIKAL